MASAAYSSECTKNAELVDAHSISQEAVEIGLGLVTKSYRQKNTEIFIGGNMNRGQVYASRKNFIENGIGALMAAKEDFLDIKYARAAVTEQEYVRVRDIFGKASTFEITGDNLEKILSDMCRVILMGEENVSVPTGYIDDKETLRKISSLFN